MSFLEAILQKHIFGDFLCKFCKMPQNYLMQQNQTFRDLATSPLEKALIMDGRLISEWMVNQYLLDGIQNSLNLAALKIV